MEEARFAERFGALLLERGWHCAASVDEFGWKDLGHVSPSPWDTYETRRAAHVEKLRQIINWSELQEKDFEIGWWDKFCGTFQGHERTQLIRVVFPLSSPWRGSVKLLWAAELDLSEAIATICSDMVIKKDR